MGMAVIVMRVVIMSMIVAMAGRTRRAVEGQVDQAPGIEAGEQRAR